MYGVVLDREKEERDMKHGLVAHINPTRTQASSAWPLTRKRVHCPNRENGIHNFCLYSLYLINFITSIPPHLLSSLTSFLSHRTRQISQCLLALESRILNNA